jgi:P27 family predicted phage terminase small subunit
MARGRKPAPTSLKILKGTQPCRVNPAGPTPGPAPPEPPENLDPEALAEWNRLAPKLAAMGVLTEVDGPALAIYCRAHSRAMSAQVELDLHGAVIETRLGGMKSNPAAAIVSRAETTMLKVLAEFGAGPASRSRVTVKAEGPRDELAEFLSRRKAKAK